MHLLSVKQHKNYMLKSSLTKQMNIKQ